MTRHRSAILACAALSTALWAVAAQAESTRAFEGSGEVPRAVPDAGEISVRAKPRELLRIEEGEASRDLQLDPRKIEESFGAIGRSRDGTETRVPPSDELREIIHGDAANKNRGGRKVLL